MSRTRTRPLSSALLALALGLSAAAGVVVAEDDLDGRAIVERADQQNRADDEKDSLGMTIISGRGEKRRRELTTYFKAGEQSRDRSLVRVDSPPDVKGTGLLTLEKGDDDEQWLYLPDLRKSKRIAGATKSQAFLSSDFTNFDMRTEDLERHDYKKTGEAEVDGRACYVVEATPRSEEGVEETGYSRRVIYVDKERFTIPKGEYYDRSGKLLKVLTADGFKQVDGLWRAGKITMENKQEGSKTILAFATREINKGVEDKLFTKRALENP